MDMNKITLAITEDMMQKLERQNQPLQDIFLQALYDYLQKYPEIQTTDLEQMGTEKLYCNLEINKSTSDGQRMAEALSQIAGTSSLTDLDPIAWQREIRGDRQASYLIS